VRRQRKSRDYRKPDDAEHVLDRAVTRREVTRVTVPSRMQARRGRRRRAGGAKRAVDRAGTFRSGSVVARDPCARPPRGVVAALRPVARVRARGTAFLPLAAVDRSGASGPMLRSRRGLAVDRARSRAIGA